MKKTYIGILVLSAILLSGCGNITGNVPLNQCELVTQQAQFESKIKDDKGIGCITDCQANVWVKNIENQPNRISVTADCTTVNGIKQISSGDYWIQPQGEHTFNIKVPVGIAENWKCENFQIHSDKIYGCKTI